MQCSGGAESADPKKSVDPLGFAVDVQTGGITGQPQRVRDGYIMRLRVVNATGVLATVATWTFDVQKAAEAGEAEEREGEQQPPFKGVTPTATATSTTTITTTSTTTSTTTTLTTATATTTTSTPAATNPAVATNPAEATAAPTKATDDQTRNADRGQVVIRKQVTKKTPTLKIATAMGPGLCEKQTDNEMAANVADMDRASGKDGQLDLRNSGGVCEAGRRRAATKLKDNFAVTFAFADTVTAAEIKAAVVFSVSLAVNGTVVLQKITDTATQGERTVTVWVETYAPNNTMNAPNNSTNATTAAPPLRHPKRVRRLRAARRWPRSCWRVAASPPPLRECEPHLRWPHEIHVLESCSAGLGGSNTNGSIDKIMFGYALLRGTLARVRVRMPLYLIGTL